MTSKRIAVSSLLGIATALDDFMGPPWEDAFRAHLRRRAAQNDLTKKQIVAIGP